MARAKATYDLVAQDKSKKAFGTIKKSLGGLKGAIGGLGLAFGAAGFVKFIGGALNAGDEIQKLSIRTGASTEFLSEMRGALELSGVGFQQFERSFRKGQKLLEAAASGSSGAVAKFAAMGLSIEALQALKPEEQFEAMSIAIASIEDPTQRAALQAEALGANSGKLLAFYEQSPEAIAAMRAEQVLFGNSLTRDMTDKMANTTDAMAKLGQQMSGIGSTLAVEFSDPIIQGAQVLSDLLIPMLKFTGNVFGALGDIIGATAAALVAFFSGDFSEAFSIASLAVSDLTDRFTELDEAPKPGVGLGGALDIQGTGGSGKAVGLSDARVRLAEEKAAGKEAAKLQKAKDRELAKAAKVAEKQRSKQIVTAETTNKLLKNAGFAIAG